MKIADIDTKGRKLKKGSNIQLMVKMALKGVYVRNKAICVLYSIL